MSKVSDNILAYYFVNSVFVSSAYVLFLDKIYGTQIKGIVAIAAAIFIILSYYLIEQDLVFLRFTLGLYDRLIMFVLFQGFLIILLSLALGIKDESI